MRLINCKTLAFESFEHSEAPSYAILSHTWGHDEVLFQDFFSLDTRVTKQGWRKIKSTCRQALSDNLGYAWVDSCCINKESSSELSESINSMFRWYAHSAHCYVFLSDYRLPSTSLAARDITASNWFNRGWTLQELIAPTRLAFFDDDWRFVGTKKDLVQQIYQRTKITRNILLATNVNDIRGGLDECTIAMRMSWAASRKTKRPEDMAYCLLGIFDISLPMLYGEGKRAFIRLQEEIIKDSTDMSIFAWQSSSTMGPAHHVSELKTSGVSYRGVLAESPSEFYFGYDIMPGPRHHIPEYSMTNRGLKIDVHLTRLSRDTSFMPLDYLYPYWDPQNARQVGLCLLKVGEGEYARTNAERLLMEPLNSNSTNRKHSQVYLSKHINASKVKALESNRRLEFKVIGNAADQFSRGEVVPRDLWDPVNEVFIIPSDLSSFVGYQQFCVGSYERFLIICGYEPPDNPWICFIASGMNDALYRAAKASDLRVTAALGRQCRYTELKMAFVETRRIKLERVVRKDSKTRVTTFNVVLT